MPAHNALTNLNAALGVTAGDDGVGMGAQLTVVAAGTTQATAEAVKNARYNVTGADGVKGVRLPLATGGEGPVLYNEAAGALLVYPETDETINGGAANAAISMAGKTEARFSCTDTGNWGCTYVPRVADDVQAVTATTGGGTTGLITEGSTFVTVTSDSADKQISLPAAQVGDRIRILVGATGCELISAVAGHKVNDVVVGATNEAALTALNLYDCQYVATNTWVVVGYTKLGAVQAALVPDTL